MIYLTACLCHPFVAFEGICIKPKTVAHSISRLYFEIVRRNRLQKNQRKKQIPQTHRLARENDLAHYLLRLIILILNCTGMTNNKAPGFPL